MASTTVVTDDSVTTVIEQPQAGPFEHRFSWSAIVSGALVAAAVTFFLLALGSGFGLSLVSVRHATADSTVTFLTLGAVYFFAAQAFGFAAGGHVAGRLMGPVLENPKEEEFLAGAHGLVTWALAVVVTASMLYLGALASGSIVASGAILGSTMPNAGTMTPAENGYWVDRLFRSAPQAAQASLAWREFAQADTGTATDASPIGAPTTPPATVSDAQLAPTAAPAATTPAPGRVEHDAPGPSAPTVNFPTATMPPASTLPPVNGAQAHGMAADRAEAGRILTVAMANGGSLSEIDKAQLAHLVAQDTGQNEDAAMRRVENVQEQIHADEVKAAETARKIAAYASLWTALALLFGSVVAAMSAISARWEDDRVTFGFMTRDRG